MKELFNQIAMRLALCGLAASFAVLAFRSWPVRAALARIAAIWRGLTAFGLFAVCALTFAKITPLCSGGFWYNDCVSDMCMLDEIRARRDEIYAIARKHKAEKLWVFGSCARKEERPDSDVDLLVKFGPQTTIFDYVRMQDDVSRLLGCGVDVVDSEALERERYFANEVQKDMVAI